MNDRAGRWDDVDVSLVWRDMHREVNHGSGIDKLTRLTKCAMMMLRTNEGWWSLLDCCRK